MGKLGAETDDLNAVKAAEDLAVIALEEIVSYGQIENA